MQNREWLIEAGPREQAGLEKQEEEERDGWAGEWAKRRMTRLATGAEAGKGGQLRDAVGQGCGSHFQAGT